MTLSVGMEHRAGGEHADIGHREPRVRERAERGGGGEIEQVEIVEPGEACHRRPDNRDGITYRCRSRCHASRLLTSSPDATFAA